MGTSARRRTLLGSGDWRSRARRSAAKFKSLRTNPPLPEANLASSNLAPVPPRHWRLHSRRKLLVWSLERSMLRRCVKVIPLGNSFVPSSSSLHLNFERFGRLQWRIALCERRSNYSTSTQFL